MAAATSSRTHKMREEFDQLGILTRHFFRRLFRNDIVDFEDQMKERLIALLAILAIFIGWSSHLLAENYLFLPDNNQSWQEKTYIFTLMMVLFGIITVLEWDVLFLDRRDFISLRPLPIRLRTLFCAKLASLIMFVGLFSIAMNSVSSFIFASYLADWRSKSLGFAVRYVVAHILSSFAACFCVFFACIFLQVFLMAGLPYKIYLRISPLVRLVLIAALVFTLMALIIQPSLLGSSFNSLAGLKDKEAPFIFLFPPLWFSGLYEVLLGTHDPLFVIQAKMAGLALLISLAAFILASGLSYCRHTLKTLEAKKGGRPKLFWLREHVAETLQNAILWSPEERAVASFFSKTIRASPKHLMTLTNYVAVAASFILLFVIVNRQSFRMLVPENAMLLAQPLILSIVLLAGLRAVADIPAAPEARWVFQVTETIRRIRYISGLKKAIFFKWFLPLSALVFLSHLILWRDWRSAFNHAIFGLTVSSVGIEAFFYRFRKIPFACTNVPGKLKLQTRGIPYLLGFIALLAVLSNIEMGLLRKPSYFWVFFVLSAISWVLLRMNSARFLKTNPLIYEEEPEPAMIVFPGNV